MRSICADISAECAVQCAHRVAGYLHARNSGVHVQHTTGWAGKLAWSFPSNADDGGLVTQQPAESNDYGRGLVAFIPGTWMHDSSWAPWQSVFDRNGYDSLVVGGTDPAGITQGTDARRNKPAGITFKSLLRVCTAALSKLAEPPILIGHGSGALLAQVLLDRRGVASAAIALCPARAGWVSRTALPGVGRTAVTVGHLAPPFGRRISQAAFVQSYANTRPVAEAADLYRRYVIAGSCRPLLQAAYTLHSPGGSVSPTDRPPLLLVSGGKDRLIPEATARSWERYGRRRHPDSVTDHHVFPDRGHSLTVDRGSEDVANFCLDWLSSQNL